MTDRICVIGAGSWGTALGMLLSNNGHEVSLWHRNKEFLQNMETDRENSKYLPGIIFPENLKLDYDLENSIKNSNIVVLAVASSGVREICKFIKPFLQQRHTLVNVAKGFESNTLHRMSQVIEQEIPDNEVVVLSGPSHAEEVAKNIPTTVVVSGKSRKATEHIQDIFMAPKFRVYTNPDIIGVELGGALKNVIALGAGISDGLGYGDNTKSALMTRGIVEISRLGEAMGANIITFAGLTGIGDLIVTCTSMHSRNRRTGIQLGQGKKLQEVLHDIGMVVEGIGTTKAAYQLSKKFGVEMPITSEIYNVLYNKSDVRDSVNSLMLRNKTHEMEELAIEYYKEW